MSLTPELDNTPRLTFTMAFALGMHLSDRMLAIREAGICPYQRDLLHAMKQKGKIRLLKKRLM